LMFLNAKTKRTS